MNTAIRYDLGFITSTKPIDQNFTKQDVRETLRALPMYDKTTDFTNIELTINGIYAIIKFKAVGVYEETAEKVSYTMAVIKSPQI